MNKLIELIEKGNHFLKRLKTNICRRDMVAGMPVTFFLFHFSSWLPTYWTLGGFHCLEILKPFLTTPYYSYSMLSWPSSLVGQRLALTDSMNHQQPTKSVPSFLQCWLSMVGFSAHGQALNSKMQGFLTAFIMGTKGLLTAFIAAFVTVNVKAPWK